MNKHSCFFLAVPNTVYFGLFSVGISLFVQCDVLNKLLNQLLLQRLVLLTIFGSKNSVR